MTNQNANIYVSSVSKLTKRFEAYGTGDIMDIALLKLCLKYACYANDYETLQRINKIISDLQMKDNDICMDFSNVSDVVSVEFGQGSTPSTNTPPTVDSQTVDLTSDKIQYIFSLADFTNNFYDAEGHSPGAIVVKSLPANPLLYNEEVVILGQTISNPSLLTYDRISTSSYVDTFNFSIFDNYLDDPKESIDTLITINVEDSDNQSATIGDNTIYEENRATTVLTLAMFTSDLAPPYNDPEGDLIDAIRIDEISQANNGIYKLNGLVVVPGEIITREQLAAELFVHEASDEDDASSDSFSFSARDEGSGIWVN